jgi:hypothetical protein
MLSRLLALGAGKRQFRDLSEKEILVVAISSEEEGGRIYAAYATMLRPSFSNSAAMFDGMAAEESEHGRRLIDVYQNGSGTSSFLSVESISGTCTHRLLWLVKHLGLDRIRARGPRWSRRRTSST